MIITKKELKETIKRAKTSIKGLQAETKEFPYMKRANDFAEARLTGEINVCNRLLNRNS